jgi:hypothetical protein
MKHTSLLSLKNGALLLKHWNISQMGGKIHTVMLSTTALERKEKDVARRCLQVSPVPKCGLHPGARTAVPYGGSIQLVHKTSETW